MPTKTETNVRFSSGVDLSDDPKSKLIDLLNARLADTIDVKTQVKHAHWNVKGLQFHQLQSLFDDVATHLDDAADLIAERAVQLSGPRHRPHRSQDHIDSGVRSRRGEGRRSRARLGRSSLRPG